MAVNYPGPYECRINYITPGAYITDHQLRFSFDTEAAINVEDPVTAVTTLSRDTTNPLLSDVISDLVDAVSAIMNNGSSFVDAEIWEYEEGTYNATYKTGVALGVAGTNATALSPTSQMIMTFRSTLGGIAKLDIRNSIYGPGDKVAYANALAFQKAIMDVYAGAAYPFLARDNGYVFSPLYVLPGENEHAAKIRYGRIS